MNNFLFHPLQRRAMYTLSMFVLLSAQIILLYFIYAFIIQKPPATDVFIEPTEKIATSGGTLVMKISVDSSQRHKVHGHRSIECDNGTITILAPDDIIIPKGKLDYYKEIIIPERIEAGVCSLHIEATTRVNLLREITTYHTSTEFKVIKP